MWDVGNVDLQKEFPLHLNMEGSREQEKTEAVAFMPWKVKARPVGGLEGESVAAPAPASCGWSSFTSSVEGKTGEMRVEKNLCSKTPTERGQWPGNHSLGRGERRRLLAPLAALPQLCLLT